MQFQGFLNCELLLSCFSDWQSWLYCAFIFALTLGFFLSFLVSLVIFVIVYVLMSFLSHDELLFRSLWA